MKVKTYLPVFSGFYETQWQFDYDYIEDFINQERKDKGLFSDYNYDDLEINNASYEADIVKGIAKALQEDLSEFVSNIEIEKIVSPKAYNFSNDSADVIIEIIPNKIKDYIINHFEAFKTYLHSRYTSYDGFISHYDNNIDTWLEDTKNFTDFSIDGHRLGSILDFIARLEGIDNFSISESVLENIDALSYVENLDDVINQSDNSLFEMFTMNNFSKEYADYIVTCFENNSIQENLLDGKTLAIIQEYKNTFVEAC
jgi:hypothetical protein